MLETWVKSIVMFVLFSSMVFFLLPDDTYRKYMQTAVGCVLVILVIAPMMQADGIGDVLSFEYYKEQRQAAVSEEDGRYYTDVMEQIVESYIEDTWNIQADVTLTFGEDFTIRRLEVIVREEVGTELSEEIRQEMISGYGISEDAVFVTESKNGL